MPKDVRQKSPKKCPVLNKNNTGHMGERKDDQEKKLKSVLAGAFFVVSAGVFPQSL